MERNSLLIRENNQAPSSFPALDSEGIVNRVWSGVLATAGHSLHLTSFSRVRQQFPESTNQKQTRPHVDS